MAARHGRQNQPSYDLITGEPILSQSAIPAPANARRPRTSSMRQSTRPGMNPGGASANNINPHDTDSLLARIKSLEYELSTAAQERELATLHHATTLREAEARADSDFRKAQAADTKANNAARELESSAERMREKEEQWAHERTGLDRKLKDATAEKDRWREEAEEGREKVSGSEREWGRKIEESKGRYKQLEVEYGATRQELSAQSLILQSAQLKLTESEKECGQLEQEVLRLRGVASDAESVALLRKDVSEQVAHIRNLECENRELKSAITEMRQSKKSVEMVEEEKRTLETRLRLAESVRIELEEVKIRNEALENEKNAWTSYFDNQANQELNFDSPEEFIREFMKERLEKASLLERIGELQPEIATKDETIQLLEQDKFRLTSEMEKLKQQPAQPSTTTTDSKSKARLERQKNLAVKETEYLRAQLKALDAEESEVNSDRYQISQSTRITELEGLIDEYRKELDNLNQSINSLETNVPSTLPVGSKRPSEETQSDERVGELLRKQRGLQNSLSESQTRIKVLESELKAKSTQLSSLRSSSRLRVLELKDNPTTNNEAVKKSHLDALSSENATLKAQLSGKLPTTSTTGCGAGNELVPTASLTRLQLEIAEHHATIASRDKSLVRLKDIFRAKGLEFREAVFSLLGWQLNFQPNGKVKATSMFYHSSSSSSSSSTRPKRSSRRADSEQQQNEAGEEEEQHFIEFDGENGTMKVSGGPQSEFAKEIRGLVEFWVDGKGQVPCFLAAMTLEFYEKYGESKNRR